MRARWAGVAALLVLTRAAGAQDPLARAAPAADPSRDALAALAAELGALGVVTPATDAGRVRLLDAAADLYAALGDTARALAIANLAPASVVLGVHRRPLCAAGGRGDVDAMLAYAARLEPAARREGAVAWIAYTIPRARYGVDTVENDAWAARRRRAVDVLDSIADPTLRASALAWTGRSLVIARDSAGAREALRRARAVWDALRDTTARRMVADGIDGLLLALAPDQSPAWRAANGIEARVAWEPVPRSFIPTRLDSAVGLAREGDLAGAVEFARGVPDPWRQGTRGDALLLVAESVPLASGGDSALAPVLRDAAREAARARPSAWRERLLERIAERQLGLGLVEDALATSERIEAPEARGDVAARTQHWESLDAGARADRTYEVFLRGLRDPRSRDVLRLARLAGLRRYRGRYPSLPLRALADSLESAAMRPVARLFRLTSVDALAADSATVRETLFALQAPEAWRRARLDALVTEAWLPLLVEWVRAAPDAAVRRARALAVTWAIGRAWRWMVMEPASLACMP